MFTPKQLELERGWPGRIEDGTVVQLAAQTLQAFFTGGGSAREHAVYPLEDVLFRAPVLRPPSIRIFDVDGDFRFANPASVRGPDDTVYLPRGAEEVVCVERPAAVIGAATIGGFTIMNEWVAPALPGAKGRDFAISLGPMLVTPDQVEFAGVDWDALVEHAELNTLLLPGDVIAAPGIERGRAAAGDTIELTLPPLGVLRNYVAAPL